MQYKYCKYSAVMGPKLAQIILIYLLQQNEFQNLGKLHWLNQKALSGKGIVDGKNWPQMSSIPVYTPVCNVTFPLLFSRSGKLLHLLNLGLAT